MVRHIKPVTHGTCCGYKHYGCRCELCKKAYSEKQKQRDAKFRAAHPREKVGRKRDEKAWAYAQQYGTTVKSVRNIGIENLDRMAEHARATMFSTLRWEKANPDWYKKPHALSTAGKGMKSKPSRKLVYALPIYKRQEVPKVREKKPLEDSAKVERMMQAVDRLYALRRVA